jgi:DNA gyrase subunit A
LVDEKRPGEAPPPFAFLVKPRVITSEMKESYIDYSMSVIVGRALPDVRDGLKPVHRRILHAMNELGVGSSRAYKKCARIVGEVLGKYHPHGDQSVYDALVRMAQPFAMRYPLVDGQGNFGSVDGDGAAAMRYTEARLTKVSDEMLADIDKETVPMRDNFDGTLKEPDVLPARVPTLLLNGSQGIAVGMATNIPPHNMAEICDGLSALIERPDLADHELFKIVPGPDFPTGGIIYGRAGIAEAYTNGRGQIRVRAKTHIEPMEKDKNRIVVDEIPYQVLKSKILEQIADLVKARKIEGITDLRDESDKDGMRIVIELRRDVFPEIILNQLYKHTELQATFGAINLALVEGQPQVLTLRAMMQRFLEFRELVITKRTQFDLGKARDRAHVLEGLVKAVEQIDAVIKVIRASKDAEAAEKSLISHFFFSDIQSREILKLPLRRLTSLEVGELKQELSDVQKLIQRLEKILADRNEVLAIIKADLAELKDRFGDERRTQIVDDLAEVSLEDLVPNIEVVVTISHEGYVKRQTPDAYRSQKRGGKGRIAATTKESDFIESVVTVKNHNFLLFFTSKGRAYWLKAYQIPEGNRQSKGMPIINLLPRLEQGELIAAHIPVEKFEEGKHLIFTTNKGTIKKTSLTQFANPRVTGIIATVLDEGERIVDVRLCTDEDEVVIATKLGQAARFDAKAARAMGRNAHGVRGIRLKPGDEVIGTAIVKEADILLSITEKGYGKRSQVAAYRKTHRGAGGVKNMKVTEKGGPVVGVRRVEEADQILVTTKSGMMIRTRVSEISVLGRATQGVRIIRIDEGDRVIGVSRLVEAEAEIGEYRAVEETAPPPGEEGEPDDEEPEVEGSDEADDGDDGGAPPAK